MTPRKALTLALAALAALALTPAATAQVSPARVSADADPARVCASMAAGRLVIDNIGDSLSAGEQADGPNETWWAYLRDSLRGDGVPHADVWTGGAIGGSSTADYLPGARYWPHIEFTVNNPDIVLINLGTNDYFGNVPVATYEANYLTILAEIRRRTTAPIVVIHAPWVYNAGNEQRGGFQRQVEFRDAAKRVATATNSYYVGMEWSFPGPDATNSARFYTPDLIHHTSRGQRLWYSALRGMIKSGMCG